MANAKFCQHCAAPLTPATRFCASCGQPLATQPAPAAAPSFGGNSLQSLAPWLLFASLLLIAVGYFIGASGASRRSSSAIVDASSSEGPIILAPDISSLSPEQRVDRLFNRVMALAAAGKTDSVAFFAPMAINALAALMPLDAHRRYDLGLIQLTAGDPVSARAQADTILASSPSHLLGLALAMRVATAENRRDDARRYAATLTASAVAERAKALPEYNDHAPDLSDALTEAAALRAQPQRQD